MVYTTHLWQITRIDTLRPTSPKLPTFNDLDNLFPRVSLTCELLDSDTVQDLEARVQFQGLAAALAHEAHLHGAAGRLRPLHPCGDGEEAILGRIGALEPQVRSYHLSC